MISPWQCSIDCFSLCLWIYKYKAPYCMSFCTVWIIFVVLINNYTCNFRHSQSFFPWKLLKRQNVKVYISAYLKPLFTLMLHPTQAFFKTGFLCSFGACPGASAIDQAGLELTEIHLPLPFKCWD